MTRAKLWGFTLLGLSVTSIFLAVALGVAAAFGDWPQDRIVSGTAALAVFAEVCFWTGGSLVGLTALRRRRAALGRLAVRVGFRRRG